MKIVVKELRVTGGSLLILATRFKNTNPFPQTDLSLRASVSFFVKKDEHDGIYCRLENSPPKDIHIPIPRAIFE